MGKSWVEENVTEKNIEQVTEYCKTHQNWIKEKDYDLLVSGIGGETNAWILKYLFCLRGEDEILTARYKFMEDLSIPTRFLKNTTLKDHFRVPSGVTVLGDEIFSYTKGLVDVAWLSSTGIPAGTFFKSSLEQIVMVDGIDGKNFTIGDNAFRDSNINTLTTPTTLSEIGSCAFADCGNLRNVTIRKALEETSGGVYIKAEAFRGCNNLKDFTAAGTIRAIGRDTFKSCTELEDVRLINLPVVSGPLFRDCPKLKYLTFIKNDVMLYDKIKENKDLLKTAIEDSNITHIWILNGYDKKLYSVSKLLGEEE